MNKEDLIVLGFQDIGCITITNSMICDLGGRRVLIVECLGTPNETMFICEKSRVGDHYTDLICLHNFDYDGKLTKQKVEHLIKFFENDWSFT